MNGATSLVITGTSLHLEKEKVADSRQEIADLLIARGYEGWGRSFLECGKECHSNATKVECVCCGYFEVHPHRCKLRICHKCMRKRKKRLKEQYYPILKKVVSRRGILRKVELTIKNTKNLGWGVKVLRENFFRLRRWKKYKSRIRSGLYCIEANPGVGGWNVHMHLIYEGEYIPQRELSEDWKKLTGSYIVYIQQVDEIDRSLNDVVKYLVKGEKTILDWGIDAIIEYMVVLEDKRLIQTFGNWFNYKFEDDEWAGWRCPVCGESVKKIYRWDESEGKWILSFDELRWSLSRAREI